MIIRVIYTNTAGKFTEAICETMDEAITVRDQQRTEGRFARIYAGRNSTAARGA